MKKIRLIILVVAALVCGTAQKSAGTDPSHVLPSNGEVLIEPALVAFSNDQALAAPAGQIRVAFYNIEMFTDGIDDDAWRTAELARNQARDAGAIVDELNADILLISESENERVLAMLNESLARPYANGFVAAFGSGGARPEKMNIGLLSRLRPASVDEIDFQPLTGEGRPTRGLLRVTYILDEQHGLLIYATHLKSNFGKKQKNYSQRYHAMRLIKEDIERFVAAHPEKAWEKMIIADFNSDPATPRFADDPTWQVLTDWRDLWREHPQAATIHTIPTRYGDAKLQFPPALFDRVLVHPALREAPWTVSLPSVIARGTVTSDVHVKPGQDGHVSDHYPIYVDLVR